jgi:hypothetical protein
MGHFRTFEWACSHKLPKLILCEEAKRGPERSHCINPSHGFNAKAKPAKDTACDDCQRCNNADNDTVLHRRIGYDTRRQESWKFELIDWEEYTSRLFSELEMLQAQPRLRLQWSSLLQNPGAADS